ncbi:unnamed protein product [Ostreobium quekettii]|uniref:Uncharacterized protein n=1 Tax=Ostreobium quekettii TaxID=121088 RepID=A0A8S1JDR1_9CHLO|nr:unnamed protein product [Ostreobium quekettii]
MDDAGGHCRTSSVQCDAITNEAECDNVMDGENQRMCEMRQLCEESCAGAAVGNEHGYSYSKCAAEMLCDEGWSTPNERLWEMCSSDEIPGLNLCSGEDDVTNGCTLCKLMLSTKRVTPRGTECQKLLSSADQDPESSEFIACKEEKHVHAKQCMENARDLATISLICQAMQKPVLEVLLYFPSKDARGICEEAGDVTQSTAAAPNAQSLAWAPEGVQIDTSSLPVDSPAWFDLKSAVTDLCVEVVDVGQNLRDSGLLDFDESYVREACFLVNMLSLERERGIFGRVATAWRLDSKIDHVRY